MGQVVAWVANPARCLRRTNCAVRHVVAYVTKVVEWMRVWHTVYEGRVVP